MDPMAGRKDASGTSRRSFDWSGEASPLQAIAAWLTGNFAIYEEPAMLKAIRKDIRITLPDGDIAEFLFQIIGEEGWDAERCLELLAQKSRDASRVQRHESGPAS
jgi:hypothetical protein